MLGLSSFGTTVVGFFGGIVLARLLGPEDFGVVALAGTIYTFIDVRSKMALDQRYVQLPETDAASRNIFLSVSLAIGLATLVLITIAAVVSFTAFSRADIAAALIAIGFIGLSDALVTAFRVHVEKQLAFRGVSLVTTIGFLTQFAVSILGAALGFGWPALITGLGAGSLTTLAGYLVLLRPHVRFTLPLASVKDFLAYGLRYGAAYSISGIVLTSFDNLAVGTLAGTSELGLYDRAYKTASWPNLLVSSVLQRVTLPTYRRLSEFPKRLSDAFSMSLWLLAIAALPVALAVFVAAPDLVLFAYGPRWVQATPILRILLLFSLTRPLLDDSIAILVATGRSGTMTKMLGTLAWLLVIAGVPATITFGAVGMAITVGIVFMLEAAFVYWFANRIISVNLRSVLYAPAAAVAVALAGYVTIGSWLDLNQIDLLFRLIVKVSLVLAIFYSTILTFDRTNSLRRIRSVFGLLVPRQNLT